MYAVAIQIFNGINSAFVQVVLILKKFIILSLNDTINVLQNKDIITDTYQP